MVQMVNLCGKIPADLHEKVRQEIEQTGSSTQKFVQQVVEEHFQKGEIGMEMRTLAVQVSEELFGRVKAVVAKMGCKQKEFLLASIEAAVAEEEKRLGLAENIETNKVERSEQPEEVREGGKDPESDPEGEAWEETPLPHETEEAQVEEADD